MKHKLIKADDLHAKWMKKPDYAKAYADFEPEFALASELITARTAAWLTQEGLAKRMKTTLTVVARLESGKTMPSTRTLKRFATATGHRLVISFAPAAKRKRVLLAGKRV